MHRLVPHPDTPAKRVSRVTAQVARSGPRELWLEYWLDSAETVVLPGPGRPGRAEGLWKSTCFELFVQPLGSDGYFEFNFSPSCQWGAYEFSGYRHGRRDLPTHDPEIILSRAGEWFFLAVEALSELPPGTLKLGLSAVIEEGDGTLSYWALAHPPGKPDFHHPDCFALELPAPEGA